MKPPRTHTPLILLLALLFVPLRLAAQGSLTPPGAPVPTMKTLDQLEPRVPIGALPFAIAAPGSYYLTTNLTGASGDGITISADHVTLDLNGFVLAGNGGRSGIAMPQGRKNLVVKNGTVRGWTSDGISAANASGGQFAGLRAMQNGGAGLVAGTAMLIQQCTFAENTADGVNVNDGSLVRDCVAAANGRDGVVANSSVVVQASVCSGNGTAGAGAGVHVRGTACRVQDNQLADNDTGLRVDGAGNYVAANTVRANSVNYSLMAGNQLNLVLSEIPQSIDWPANVTLAGSLSGSAGGNGITVNSDGVTIDLNGQSLTGGAGSLGGIVVSGARRNLTVKNGTIRGWGVNGVSAAIGGNGQFLNLRVAENGGYGLSAGSGSLVRDCTAQGNVHGIAAGASSRVVDCVVSANGGNGITVDNASTVQNCTANNNTGDGIRVGNKCVILGNTCDRNTSLIFSAGIRVTGSENILKDNQVVGNDRGLGVEAERNFISRNIASDNSLNYALVGSQALGTIISLTDSITTDNPWANFDF